MREEGVFFPLSLKKHTNIQLTHRGKYQGQDIPMCGIPHKALSTYEKKLIKQGLKIAICDQTEDPKEAKMRKSVVNRELTRL